MTWYVLALFLPALMVVVFSMVVRNKYTGLLLATVVIGVSVYKGFFHSEMIVFIDTMSLIIGYLLVDWFRLHES